MLVGACEQRHGTAVSRGDLGGRWDPANQGRQPQKLAGRSGLRFSKNRNNTTSNGMAPRA